ncbi:histidine ammonia-lyase [Bradyrhizobium diazoefficiens]
MTEQDAAIVVKPGTVSLDDLARVLAGQPVVLDPSFWPRVEAAAAIVAKAAPSGHPRLRHQYRLRKARLEAHPA